MLSTGRTTFQAASAPGDTSVRTLCTQQVHVAPVMDAVNHPDGVTHLANATLLATVPPSSGMRARLTIVPMMVGCTMQR